MTQVPYIIRYMFPNPGNLPKAEEHVFKLIFLMYLIIYLFLNFDFLIISHLVGDDKSERQVNFEESQFSKLGHEDGRKKV